MSENSKIEWTDHTFNPWEGCQKVGPGCDNCYAENRNARFAGGAAINWGPGAPRRRTSAANWRKPLVWNRDAGVFYAAHGRRQRVFCASLADVFDNAVDPQWRDDLFALIEQTPNLDWLLLTKRIGNVGNMLPVPFDFDRLYPNVWLGATICNQAEADRDIPKLLAVPAARRFLSMEPLLGPVDLEYPVSLFPGGPARCCGGHECGCGGRPTDPPLIYGIDWIIVGGESGPGARPMHPDWARSLRDQCTAAGVPFLFKQWGEFVGSGQTDHDLDFCYENSKVGGWVEIDGRATMGEDVAPGIGAIHVFKLGKKAAGRLLDGVQHDGYPVDAIAELT